MTCMQFRIGSMFTGVAGLDRGVEQALAEIGHTSTIVWQAEKDPYARAVLARHYPTVHCYEDVHDVDASAPSCNLLVGGFPCQDLSVAGKRTGIYGASSGLWFEYLRCVRVLGPSLVFVENVPGLATYLGYVLGPLAELGFDAEWGLLSAAEIGAPHRRDRMFVLAYTNGYRFPDPQQQVYGQRESTAWPRNDGGSGDVADPNGGRELQSSVSRETVRNWTGHGGGCRAVGDAGRWPAEPDVGRVVDGISSRLDARRRRARIRCLGNGVVAEQAALAFITLARRAGLGA